MRVVASIFLLFTYTLHCSAQDVDCEANDYPNDPSLLPLLNGFLFNTHTSQPRLNVSNEVSKCVQKDGHIFIRTTSDNVCCRTAQLETVLIGDHFTFTIENEEGCSAGLDEPGLYKLIATNARRGHRDYCLVEWTCRASRGGIQVFCTKQKLTESEERWISAQFRRLGATEYTIPQNRDISNGKCFNHWPGRDH